ncbi:MAG TPA: SDR family oxidoreductase [Pirellulales bacterium]|nr:SDR family oxidoreductase [Pirellulales bacterium]
MTNSAKAPPAEQPVALVTGAGAPRIGSVVARALSARGYRLAVHANTSIVDAQRLADELSAAGSESITVAADVRDERAVSAAVRRAHDHFGRIDALVNCAAIWQKKRLEEVTADDVRRNFEINTLGTFLFCQQVGQIMVGQTQGGTIVNFGDWAIARPYLDYAAYFPSKGAIPTLTRTFAAELASRNPRIRVNAILPGPVMLPDDLSPSERAKAIAGTLLRREGSPQNIAQAVVFLLENDYITGVCLPVDGGRSVFGI